MNKQKPQHVGSIVLAYDAPGWSADRRMFLVKNAPKNNEDNSRERKRVGISKWVPAGGGYEPSDRSQRHAARRELWEESGYVWKVPLTSLRRVGVLECYFTAKGKPRSFEHSTLKWIVHLYETVITGWRLTRQPRPSKGISHVGWFPVRLLPWNEMMDDSKLWIPRMIDGEQLRVRILRHYRHERLMDHETIQERFS